MKIKRGERKAFVKWKVRKKERTDILLSIKSIKKDQGYLILQYKFESFDKKKSVKERETKK